MKHLCTAHVTVVGENGKLEEFKFASCESWEGVFHVFWAPSNTREILQGCSWIAHGQLGSTSRGSGNTVES